MNLWHWLLGHGASEEAAMQLMNGYAHELAERQRKAGLDWGGVPDMDAFGAADLIDPLVQQPPVDEYRLSTRPGVVGGEQ